ncbi:MAG: ATP-binding protein [bacterium]|nr:ATP-binding protein [bacterium]
MTEFRRAQVSTLIQRLSERPEFIIAIFGPRQTGKTTAVLQAISAIEQGYRYEAMEPTYNRADPLLLQMEGRFLPLGSGIDAPAASEPDVRRLAEIWQHCRYQAMRSPRGFVLVLDEIQRIEGWSEAVKGFWDADRREGCPLHVVILGSAPLLMQKGLHESLAGRFEPIRFPHWSYAEMSEAFGLGLDEYVYFGGYPGAASRISDPEHWGEYVRAALIGPAIERDVLSMVTVDKPELLKRLFDLGARYSGQQVSYNKLLGHLQNAGNTTTLTRYLGLLARVGMIAGLPKQTNRPAPAKAPTPKLNVLNTALMSAVCGHSFDEARADRSHWGRLTESCVGAHLLNAASSRTEVKYWRDKGHEVDFVLHRGPHLVGIEVKSGKAPVATKGLEEFEGRFQPVNTVVVGEAGVPLHEFLALPPDHWFDSP